jgi:cytochrome c oxidase cbb3-type subunit 3
MKAALHSVAAMCAALCAALLATGCERERRDFEPPQGQAIAPGTRNTAQQPGEPTPAPAAQAADMPATPYTVGDNAFAVSQGKRLYRWYNCSACHAPGGGGDWGPALSDDKWIYGSAPNNIFLSIVQGRPNGMPSFGGHIPEDQVWQLVAYVRSLSGQLRKDVAPGRSDSLQASEPEVSREREHPQPYLPRDGAQNPTR